MSLTLTLILTPWCSHTEENSPSSECRILPLTWIMSYQCRKNCSITTSTEERRRKLNTRTKYQRIPKEALTLTTSILPSTPNTWRNAAEKALLWRLLLRGPVLCMSVPSTSKVINTLLAIARSLADDDDDESKEAKRKAQEAQIKEWDPDPSIHPLNHPSIHIRILTSVGHNVNRGLVTQLIFPSSFFFF